MPLPLLSSAMALSNCCSRSNIVVKSTTKLFVSTGTNCRHETFVARFWTPWTPAKGNRMASMLQLLLAGEGERTEAFMVSLSQKKNEQDPRPDKDHQNS